MHVDKIGYHFNEVNILHGSWERYGRQVDGETFKNSNKVESSHIVLLILKLKKYFNPTPSDFDITKISQFGEGMGNTWGV